MVVTLDWSVSLQLLISPISYFLYEVRDSRLGSDIFVLWFCRAHFALAFPPYPTIKIGVK